MERPFFSLAKRKRLKPIDYTSPDRSAFVKVLPHSDNGKATIWDTNILIWAASVINRAEEPPGELHQPQALVPAL